MGSGLKGVDVCRNAGVFLFVNGWVSEAWMNGQTAR